MVTGMLRILLALVAVFSAVWASADPPPTNAADAYRPTFETLMEAWRPPEPGQPLGFAQSQQLITDWAVSGEPPTPEVRAAFERIRPVLDRSRVAASITPCDFGLDRSAGFSLTLPHLMPMRALARLYGAEAALAMHDGEWTRATDSLAAVARIGRHAKSDGFVKSSMVSAAVLTLADERIGDLEATGELDAESATRLLGELQAFGAVDPLGLGQAFTSEADMARASIEGLIEKDPANVGGKLAELFGTPDATESLAKLSADDLRGQLDQTDALYREIASLAASPDRAARAARIAEIEAEVSEGKHGELAKVLLPSASRVFDIDDDIAAMLTAREKSLRSILDGADPALFADARSHYRALAKMSLGVDPEAQRIIELIRLAPKLADTETRVLAERALAPMRNTLAEEFRAAAACERCRWRRSPRESEVRFLPDEIVALRAAARIARADALLRATAPETELRADTRTPPLTVAESLEFGLALVQHLGMDPAFSQSVIAEAIARELASDLRDARAAGLVDDAPLARLAERLAKLDRADPFSFRAGMAADADRSFTPDLGLARRGDAARAKAVAAMSKAPADSFALVTLREEVLRRMRDLPEEQNPPETEAEIQAIRKAKVIEFLIARRDAGALLGWSDLFHADLEAAADASFLPAVLSTALLEGGSLPSPPFPLGFNERMNAGGGTISALDAAVEPVKPSSGQ